MTAVHRGTVEVLKRLWKLAEEEEVKEEKGAKEAEAGSSGAVHAPVTPRFGVNAVAAAIQRLSEAADFAFPLPSFLQLPWHAKGASLDATAWQSVVRGGEFR